MSLGKIIKASSLGATNWHRSTLYCLEHGNSSTKKSCSFKDHITVTCISRTIRSSCRGSTQEGSTTPLSSPALYLCSVLTPPPFIFSQDNPCSPAHGCLALSISPGSQLAPPTRPAAMGKRAQLLRAVFTPGLFSTLKKESPLSLAPGISSADSSPPATGFDGGIGALVGGWGGWGTRISSGSVAEQQLQSGD